MTWSPREVRPGDALNAVDARGKVHPCRATSTYEPERALNPASGRYRWVHDFPVVWVSFEGRDPVPWPVEWLRPPGSTS